MKRTFLALTVCILLVPALPTGLAAQEISAPHVPGELLVGFPRPFDAGTKASVHRALGARVIESFDEAGVDHVRLPPGLSVAPGRALYLANRSVLFAEPNYLRRAYGVTPNDPSFSSQWALRNTGQTGGTPDADIDASEAGTAPDAWSVQTGSATTVVAVIDTGLQDNHPDLNANLWINPGEGPTSDGVDNDGNGKVDDIHGWDFANNDATIYDPTESCPGGRNDDHGTHVAGTIGAVGNNGQGVAGVNWVVRMMVLKFMRKVESTCGVGSDANAIEAILYATRMGAQFINVSWGGPEPSEALRQAFIAAGRAGILFAAAAGNEGLNLALFPQYPPSFDLDNEVVVAASDSQDQRASFSNFGGPTDLAAPGVDILSTLTDSSYGNRSGTSMSAPHVTGAIALLRSQYPHAPPLELKERLVQTVDPKAAFASPITQSGGRLNLNAALRQVRPVIPTVVTPNGEEDFVPGSSTTVSWDTNVPVGNPQTQYRVEFTEDALASKTVSHNFESGVPSDFTEPADSDAPWMTVATPAHPGGSGSFSLRSGAVGSDQASWASTTVRLAGPGTVSFWYRLSSENCESPETPVCGDYLRFFADGQPLFGRAGEIGWTELSFPLVAGTHNLSWAYQKDALCPGPEPECADVALVEDAAWIDDVVITGVDDVSWSHISTTSSGATNITWVVPNTFTTKAKIRICQSTGSACAPATSDESDGTFTIQGRWSPWEPLGGVLASGPDVSSWASGRLDVFAHGTDNQLWHKWYDGTWSSWEPLGGVLTGGPGAVSWAEGRIDVFVRGGDNQLWHRWYDGAWSPWELLGGVLASGPDVSSWAPGRLDVFVQGTDNQLWHKWWDGSSWSHWEPLGGVLTGGPGAVSWSQGRIDVFVRGGDNQLWHRWYDGTWSPWEPLGGVLASDPDASTRAPERLDVFVQGSDDQLYRKWFDGSWSAYEGLGSPSTTLGTGIISGPGAVSWGVNRIDILVRARDRSLWHRSFGL